MNTRTPRTRASTTAQPAPTAPATRSRKPSIAVENTQTTTPAVTRKLWNSSTATAEKTNKLTKPPSAVKPLWSSSKANEDATGAGAATRTRPSSALGRVAQKPAGPSTPVAGTGAGRQSTLLAVPRTERKRTMSVAAGVSAVGIEGERRAEVLGYDATREPIQAYLRVRPAPPNALSSGSYIQVLSNTEVVMVPPADHRHNAAASSSADPFGSADQHVYKFTGVFPSLSPSSTASAPAGSPPTLETDSQASFFRSTTLPLVADFLAGQNCLLFAYGPTGSGKTWTVQGGHGEKAGLLPRVMDVVWRSVEGKESRSNLRPTRLAGVEMSPPPTRKTPAHGPAMSTPPHRGGGRTQAEVQQDLLDDVLRRSFAQQERTEGLETVPVDDAYEYSIWVSYAEIYNEKIYDLLDSPVATSPPLSLSASHTSSTPSTSSSVLHFGLGLLGVGAKAKSLGLKGFQTIKRNALSLKSDQTAGNKYVAGMQEVRVHSAEDARALLNRGQANRQVFSTLANRVSSRSHSIFTIKVLRIHKGAANPDDPSAVAGTTRFSIVDLAGSERVVNTQTTGDRLKEAGNINKSLMCLGQCMASLRKNQEMGKGGKPVPVPFRHSKLTELFQSFFTGDGKAVMIVNVNPHETGFDENSHVMKFSAVAKGVMTVKNNVPVPVLVAPTPLVVEKPEPRLVRLSIVPGGEEQDILYEEEDADDEPEEEEDEFVNALLEELSRMRTALFESQLNSIMAVSRTRSEMAAKHETEVLKMERDWQNKLSEQSQRDEEKLNAKLDLVAKYGQTTTSKTTGHGVAIASSPLTATPTASSTYDDSDEEDDREESEEEEDEDADEVEKMLVDIHIDADRSLTAELDESPAALAGVRSHVRGSSVDFDSPLPAPKAAPPMLGESVAMRDDEEDEDGEEDDDEDEEDDDLRASGEEDGEEEASYDDIEVPHAGSSFEDDEDSGGSDFEDDEDDGSEGEYLPKPTNSRASNGRRATPRVSIADLKEGSSPQFEVLVETQAKQTKGKKGAVATRVVDEGEGDESFAFDKSVVIRAGEKAKKPKRKLGGHKIKDADDIDLIADAFSPHTMTKSSSGRGLLAKSTSMRSLNKR